MSDIPSSTGIDLTKSIDLRPGADPARERAQVAQLAQEFEAMLMLQMIRGMRQSMLDEASEGEGLGGDTLKDTFDVEFSRHLARAGGFGLGALLSSKLAATAGAEAGIRQLGGLTGGQGIALPDVGAAPATFPLPADTGTPLRTGGVAHNVSVIRQSAEIHSRSSDTDDDVFRLSMPIDSTTTSAYGWRADPLNGQSRFHRGVDLRAAYGAEVPAAAAGTVVFAGERGAYGNVVIVRHDNGVETRYAHLSALGVAEGTDVDAGTVVGRVGSTGRSTAPHLHFEVLVNGERVDPERAASRLGRGPLKFPSQADD